MVTALLRHNRVPFSIVHCSAIEERTLLNRYLTVFSTVYIIFVGNRNDFQFPFHAISTGFTVINNIKVASKVLRRYFEGVCA